MDIPHAEFVLYYADKSVSHGTMRDVDLIPTFSDVAYQLDRNRADYIRSAHGKGYAVLEVTLDRLAEPTDEGLQAMADLTVALFEALERVAPEGYTFGAHEGDGSDYGFWAVECDCGHESGGYPCEIGTAGEGCGS